MAVPQSRFRFGIQRRRANGRSVWFARRSPGAVSGKARSRVSPSNSKLGRSRFLAGSSRPTSTSAAMRCSRSDATRATTTCCAAYSRVVRAIGDPADSAISKRPKLTCGKSRRADQFEFSRLGRHEHRGAKQASPLRRSQRYLRKKFLHSSAQVAPLALPVAP